MGEGLSMVMVDVVTSLDVSGPVASAVVFGMPV